MFLSGDNISFGYTADKAVLHEVSFSLRKSKTLAVVGASGCGKSTLLRIISGILPGTKNQVLTGRVSINGLTPEQYRKSGKLAFMFQESTLMPNLTVRENIAFPLLIKGIKDDEKVANLLQTVGLEEHADKLPRQLSGGMKTRVALARSFVTGPELLLLDEPFSALDIAWKSKLYIELEWLKEQNNTTVVLVTHDVQEAVLLSDEVTVLSKSGSKIRNESVDSTSGVMARLTNISSFIETDEYQRLYVAIQKWIMDDGVRFITGKSEIDSALHKLALFAGTDQECWETFEHDIISLRKYSDSAEINRLLYRAFERGKSFFFKYKLIWDIVNYSHVSESQMRSVFDFYFRNIQQGSALAAQYYKQPPDKLFDFLVETRICSPEYSEKKKWIYLCDLYFSSEVDRVMAYLDEVADGKVAEFTTSFSREVAKLVRGKIEREKVGLLHIA